LAVAPDGSRVFVTGEAGRPAFDASPDFGTVAYRTSSTIRSLALGGHSLGSRLAAAGR